MDIQFWEMSIEDYQPVRDLWRRTDGIGLHEETRDSRSAIAAYLERNRGMSYIALAGGKIIGAVLCGHDGRNGYLNHLAVDRAWQGRGIGTRLVEKVIERLADEGITQCYIDVLPDNPGAIEFWQDRGWQPKNQNFRLTKAVETQNQRFRFRARPFEVIVA